MSTYVSQPFHSPIRVEDLDRALGLAAVAERCGKDALAAEAMALADEIDRHSVRATVADGLLDDLARRIYRTL